MADNVVASAAVGVGPTFASDDIAGVHFPRSKLVWGADGTATDASAAAPLPVVQTGSLPAGTAAIGKLAANSGVDIGDVDVTSLPALPAGTNNIGDVDVLTLPALPTGTNNIGDVDVLTLPAATVAGATAKTADLDSGAGTDTVPIFGVAVAASGGAVAITGDAAQGIDVDVTRLPALAAGTNNIGDVDVLTLPALPAGTNNIGDVDVLSIAAGDNNIGNVDVVTLPALPAGTNNIGDVDVLTLPAIPAGTNNIGDVDVLSIAAGDNNIGNVDVVTLPALVAGTANIGDVDVLTLPALPTGTNTIGAVTPKPTTSGGLSVSRVISAATTNETEAKATAGQLYGVIATNINAAVRYLKIYDNTAAGTTIGTTTPKMTIPIPGNTAGAGFVWMSDLGVAFGTGITYGLTTGVADADTAAVAANEIVINLFFS